MHFQLLRPLPLLGVDSRRRKCPDVALALSRVDDMHGTLAGGKALADEGQQHLIELIVVVKERARMTTAAECRDRRD